MTTHFWGDWTRVFVKKSHSSVYVYWRYYLLHQIHNTSSSYTRSRRNSVRMWENSVPFQTSSTNLTKDEFHSIRSLSDNPNIILLKVDKGNATVIMNTIDYESKLHDLLSSYSYKPLTKTLLIPSLIFLPNPSNLHPLISTFKSVSSPIT